VFEVLFHGGEAVFELCVGVGHEEFGVGVAEAGEVDGGEEQVAGSSPMPPPTLSKARCRSSNARPRRTSASPMGIFARLALSNA
jgi:hypothetical protein